MPAVHAANAQRYEFGDVTFVRLAAPQTGSKESSAWTFTVAPKSAGVTHQITREEIMIFLDGNAVAEIGKERHVVSKGDALIIPAHTDFRLSNEGNTAVEGMAMVPVGAQAVMPGEAPFIPPWTL
jgi:mannose-6-phosphate isomerase-like protein (cupin superfamily)